MKKIYLYLKNLYNVLIQKCNVFQRKYYSSSGEDIILEAIFKNKINGFYIDIGAYHPFFFSNTYKLYLKGWRGINIDPNIESIKLFNSYRPQDTNLNIAISDTVGESDYYKFIEIDHYGGGSSNSMSHKFKEHYENLGIKSEIFKVKTDTLLNIFQKYSKSQIDFLNIDIEGFELAALQSNDWSVFRPYIIAIEILLPTINYDALYENKVYKFLRENNYKAFSNTLHTWFFVDEKIGLKL